MFFRLLIKIKLNPKRIKRTVIWRFFDFLKQEFQKKKDEKK